jgi:hypothetical protein
MLDDDDYIYNEREDPRVYGEIDLERRVEYVFQTRCLRPFTRCWDSNKPLFLKKCVKVVCALHGPGEPVFTQYYFEPKRWTLRLLKK